MAVGAVKELALLGFVILCNCIQTNGGSLECHCVENLSVRKMPSIVLMLNHASQIEGLNPL